MATVCNFILLHFLTIILLVHSSLNLQTTDHESLLSIHNDLGITTTTTTTTICTSTGIFCNRRISANSTVVLRVTRIVFNHRRLIGSISPAIGKLSELKELSLPNNHLVNNIPSQISSCRKLEVLNLHGNKFSGEVPPELSSLLRLRILDLSSNNFSGELDFLKYFPNLEQLSLADNMFAGKVPATLRSFRNLRLFNVSGNSFLEGPIPTMARLESPSEINKFVSKRYMFRESNSTKGEDNSNNNSSNNSSNNNSNNNSNNLLAPAPAPVREPFGKHNKKKTKKIVRWAVGFCVGVIAGIISGAIVSIMFKMVVNLIRGKKNDSGISIFSKVIKAEDISFLENDDGVSALEVIGKGGCGEVYKTELQNIKIKTIAIKKVIQPPKDAAELTDEDTKLLDKKMRQIKSEIQTVGQIRHRNLLPLLAHVSRPNCHYLVYEFMKNGSLQDILQEVKDGSRVLDWLARHRIALGIVAGLEYLHMSHTPRIVHRDLKPGNVLLDDEMEARIADFGLAKSIPDANTHMTSSNVAGTLGYIAPEYYQTMKFTDKCDIYSFGVVLAVLVMGKLPSDEFFQKTSEMSLVKWMRNVIVSQEQKQAIDPKLMGNGYEEQMLLVIKIAYFCTLDDPRERPNSKDVRLMLAQIKH